MKFLRALFLFFSALLVFSTVAAQGGGTLRVGVNAPVVLDPALHSADSEIAFNRAIYDYLVEVLPDSTIGPNLASDWTISDDGLTYTFNLVEGVTFHDGSPFSSADVVYTFNRLRELQSPAINLLGDFEISAPDENTVVFTLSEVNADFLYGVGARQALIIKDGQETPNVIGEDGGLANFNGTGPFILQSYDPIASAVLVRNENYWKEGEPLLDELHFVYMEDQSAQVDALLGGQVDFIFRLRAEDVARLEGSSDVNVMQESTSLHGVIRVRTDEGSLGEDVRVRQALKYATDREALNELVAEGRGTVGNNDPIAPVFTQFYDDSIENQTYDPEMACQLLTDAGQNPLEATLFYPIALDFEALATALQQQWAETGCINIDLQGIPENLYYDSSNPDNWLTAQLGITGWSAQPTPQTELVQAFTIDGIYNETQLNDAELDELIRQAGQTPDPDARAEIYAQISQIFLERGPIIIPYFQPTVGAARANVEGLVLAPFPGLTDYRTVSVSS
ncbi:MAG TPA: ABC transporter substrate-binding protein [Oceanobacillus sp.]|nr:ABC transporter substrate-binding protein [Oceanobacillus sp.]